MFLGHFGAGFAGKKIAPGAGLGILFLAAILLDLLWSLLLITGTEHVRIVPGITTVTPMDFYDYPLSHGLIMVIIIAAFFGMIYGLIKRNLRMAIVSGILVFSHWLLDLTVHRPDLPLIKGSTTVFGLGLWNYFIIGVLFELILFIIGLFMYIRVTRAIDKIGSYGLWILVTILSGIWLGSIFGSPPPDDPIKIGLVGLSQILFVIIAGWIDRHRKTVPIH
ncbi:MAG: hypothetical protein AB1746_09995 [Candidatus Zixiibacteriota bacterium]